ncbi:MAG: glycosyltransferase family protein [Alphaproteobacteria bacterium]
MKKDRILIISSYRDIHKPCYENIIEGMKAHNISVQHIQKQEQLNTEMQTPDNILCACAVVDSTLNVSVVRMLRAKNIPFLMILSDHPAYLLRFIPEPQHPLNIYIALDDAQITFWKRYINPKSQMTKIDGLFYQPSLQKEAHSLTEYKNRPLDIIAPFSPYLGLQKLYGIQDIAEHIQMLPPKQRALVTHMLDRNIHNFTTPHHQTLEKTCAEIGLNIQEEIPAFAYPKFHAKQRPTWHLSTETKKHDRAIFQKQRFSFIIHTLILFDLSICTIRCDRMIDDLIRCPTHFYGKGWTEKLSGKKGPYTIKEGFDINASINAMKQAKITINRNSNFPGQLHDRVLKALNAGSAVISEPNRALIDVFGKKDKYISFFDYDKKTLRKTIEKTLNTLQKNRKKIEKSQRIIAPFSKENIVEKILYSLKQFRTHKNG